MLDVMPVFRAILWIAMLAMHGEAQRTYQRHCECEYMVDGRCAYTLMLPRTVSGEMTCPVTNSSGTLGRLQDEVKTLQSWTGEQAKVVVMLQNAVNTLNVAVQHLQDADGGRVGETTDATPSSGTDVIKSAVEQLNRTVVELVALCRGRCSSDQLSGTNSSGLTDFEALERRLVSRYRLCAARGLIVCGINDSAITASSVNQSSSPSHVRINSTSSAWCPSDSGAYLTVVLH